MRRDVYRIDDVLLRAGLVTGLLAALVALGVFAADAQSGEPPGALLGRWAPLLVLAAGAPVALGIAGLALRRRERQVVAIWSLLRQNAVLSVPELVASSDLDRRDLSRAVRFLNNRGLAHYVWDRESDTIQDGRLAASSQLCVEKCDACGASLAIRIPFTAREIPTCPYCHDPVSATTLEERRSAAIEALRAEARPREPARGERRPFSLALFVVLLLACWPAALLYAIYTARHQPPG